MTRAKSIAFGLFCVALALLATFLLVAAAVYFPLQLLGVIVGVPVFFAAYTAALDFKDIDGSWPRRGKRK